MQKANELENALIETIRIAMNNVSLDVKKELTAAFERESINFLDFLFEAVNTNLLKEPSFPMDFVNLDYDDIFNETVKKFVSDPKNLERINDYAEQYNKLLENSVIFKRDGFNHYTAESLSMSLKDSGFFRANHEVVFSGVESTVKTTDEYNALIENERNKVFSDAALKKKFNSINTVLSKKMYSEFRRVIEKSPEILPMLADYNQFKKMVWIDVLKQIISDVESVVNSYKSCNTIVSEIKSAARTERTQWQIVLDIFKERFNIPFKIEISNQDDVLLNDKIPEFEFYYTDPDSEEEIAIERRSLEKVLSQGEKRALYLLNIIYDLEALKLQGDDVLIIADDISDSFDYKNKYAIIEYLQELTETPCLKFIVLTHNFDFFRTTALRVTNVRAFMVSRIRNGIEIINPKYIYKNPFKEIKNGIANNSNADITTAIPFVRNIIEYISYIENDLNYMKLTSLLHLKADTKTITLGEL